MSVSQERIKTIENIDLDSWLTRSKGGDGSPTTHTSLRGGAWNFQSFERELVPFEVLYAKALRKKDKLWLRCYQEVYPQGPSRVTLDIDSKRDLTPKELRTIITATKTILQELLVIPDSSALQPLVLWNRSAPRRKFHIYHPYIVVPEKGVLKDFVRRLKVLLPADLQSTVDGTYSGLRMIGSYKMASDGTRYTNMESVYLPSQPITADVVRLYSIIPSPDQPVNQLTPSYLEEKERLKRQREEEEREFEEKCKSVEISIEALEEAVDLMSVQRATIYNLWYSTLILLYLLCLNEEEFYSLAHRFSQKCPEKYDYDKVQEVCEDISDEGHGSPLLWLVQLLRKDVGEEVTRKWCARHKVPVVNKMTVGSLIEQEKKKPVEEKLWDEVEEYEEEEMRSYNPKRRVLCVKAAMGLGKTKRLIEFIKTLPDDAIIRVVSARRSLGKESAKKMEFELYERIKGTIRVRRVVCQLQSLWRLDSTECDLLVLDEFCSLLREATVAKTMRNPQKTLATLEGMILDAKQVVVMDADLVREDVELLAGWVGKKNIQVVHNTFKRHQQDHFQITNRERKWRQALSSALREGKRVVIASNSKKHANTVAAWVKKEFSKKRVLLITRDTPSEKEKEEIFASLDDALKGVDVLIYTPTISIGCSVEVEQFDMVFGWFKSRSGVGVETCLQMLYRVRQVRERMYIVLVDLSTNSLPETKEAVEEFITNNYNLSQHKLSNENVTHILRGDGSINYPHKGFYYHLWVHVLMKTNRSKNGFARRFIQQLVENGSQVEELQVDHDDEIDNLETSLAQMPKTLAKEEASRIANASDMDENEYLELEEKREDGLDEEERARFERYCIVRAYGDWGEVNDEGWVMKYSKPKRMAAFMRARRMEKAMEYGKSVEKYLEERRSLDDMVQCKFTSNHERIAHLLVTALGWRNILDSDTLDRDDLERIVTTLPLIRSEPMRVVCQSLELKIPKKHASMKVMLGFVNSLLSRVYMRKIIPVGGNMRKKKIERYKLDWE